MEAFRRGYMPWRHLGEVLAMEAFSCHGDI